MYTRILLSLDSDEQAQLQALLASAAREYPLVAPTADGVLRGLLRAASLTAPSTPAPDRRRAASAHFEGLTKGLPAEAVWALWAQCARIPPDQWTALVREARLKALLSGYSAVQAETLRIMLEETGQELWPVMVTQFRAALGLPAVSS